MITKKGWWIEWGGSKNGRFRRNMFHQQEEEYNEKFLQFASEYNATDIYTSTYLYDSEQINGANLYGPIYIDLDHEIGCEKDFYEVRQDTLLAIKSLRGLLEIREEDVCLFFSGSKGFHLTVDPRHINVTPCQDLNMHYKKIAEIVRNETSYKSVDLKIYDTRRLFRIPNSLNTKGGLYKVQIKPSQLRIWKKYDEVREWATEPREIFASPIHSRRREYDVWEWFKENCTEKQEEEFKPVNRVIRSPEGKVIDLLPCAEAAINNGCAKGNRNNTAVAIASSLFQAGYSMEEAEAILYNWNNLNEPPLPERELFTTCRSASAMTKKGQGYGCSTFKENGMCQEGCRVN